MRPAMCCVAGNCADKIVVVTNGEHHRSSPGGAPSSLREKLGVENKVVVSYIGTVGMAHGLQLILDAADECLTHVPEAQFIIVGSGAERGELQDIRPSVGDCGTCCSSVVFRTMRSSTIGALSDFTLVLLKNTPLFRTVLPSKVFEALATGTPIITNVRGELERLLEPLGAAEMIEPDSVEALVRAMAELARDPARRRLLAANAAAGGKRYERTALADSMLEALQRWCPGKCQENQTARVGVSLGIRRGDCAGCRDILPTDLEFNAFWSGVGSGHCRWVRRHALEFVYLRATGYTPPAGGPGRR